MPDTQGGLASNQGNVLESAVIAIFSKKGFETLKYREWAKKTERYGKELLLKNVPYRTIYGHDGNTEFLLKSEKYNVEIRIECKWQQSPGSVDEKFPYLYLNCIETMPENEIIIIIDGGGYKKGSLKWLKESVENAKYQTGEPKNISVFSLSEFIKWANKRFR